MKKNTSTYQIKPCGLSAEQISEITEVLRDALDYPKTSLRNCIKKLGGEFKTDNTKIDSIGGSINVDGPSNFVIFLTDLTDEFRNNFTIAHELGHYILHSRFGEIKLTANSDVNNDALEEREANCFAAEFLMPAKQIREDFKKGASISELTGKYKVSPETIIWRKENL